MYMYMYSLAPPRNSYYMYSRTKTSDLGIPLDMDFRGGLLRIGYSISRSHFRQVIYCGLQSAARCPRSISSSAFVRKGAFKTSPELVFVSTVHGVYLATFAMVAFMRHEEPHCWSEQPMKPVVCHFLKIRSAETSDVSWPSP